jgi:cysteinyl-tRNA synthetase
MIQRIKRLVGAKSGQRFVPRLYNSLGKKQEMFSLPKGVKAVRMYNCGPTVYGTQHIGNLSAAVFADTLRRLLQYDGFTVKQVMNITDFGHLTSDADEGEDKMTKGLKREGLAVTMENMKILADRYTEQFFTDIRALNVDTEQIQFPRASEHIYAEIAMVQTLEEKGYAYRADDGMYFDTARFADYGVLGGITTDADKQQARVEVKGGKLHPNDFALWKFDEHLGWDSPWGKGFPGWHIECSAMIRAVLGEQIDIHTGGIEHIAIHHNNEIAQSECATGKRPFCRFWMHRAHVQIEGAKIAKSDGNVVYLSEIIERGIHPLALRYLYLGAHYRSPSNFTWNALEAAENAFLRLRAFVDTAPESGTVPAAYRTRIAERLNDDLDTPGALATMWEMTKDAALSPADIRAGILDADQVFGLGLDKPDEAAKAAYRKRFGEEVALDSLPEDIRTMIMERQYARTNRDWHRADELRKELEAMGFSLEDTNGTPRVFRRQ